MAYNITLTNGQALVTIADGTADSSYTSLTLFGKNFAGYGPLQDKNFVQLLENFSFESAPPNALQGQLWWDSSKKVLKVFNDGGWKIVSGPTSAASAPITTLVGDLWWDSTNSQLNVFNGVDWSIIGPAYKAGLGVSGPVVTSIPGSVDGLFHTVVEFYVGGVVSAVLSKDPTFSVNAIPGYSVLKPGFNLPATGSMYYGDSENALKLGSVLAANYIRSDVASITNFAFNVKNNTGLTVGGSDNLTISTPAAGATKIINNEIDADTRFYVNIGGVSTLALQIDGATGLVTVVGNPTTSTGIATKSYVDTAIATESTGLLHADGSVSIEGTLAPTTNNLHSLGNPANSFATIYGTTINSTTVNATTGTFTSIVGLSAPSGNSAAVNKQYVDNADNDLLNQATSLNQTTMDTLVGTAPANLSDFGAVATALNNDANFAANLSAYTSGLAPINSPNFTGIPMAPTVGVSDISNKIATTAFVNERLAGVLTSGNTLVLTGGIIIDGDITTNTNDTLDIGSATNRFRKFYGTAVTASYADLAENYVADTRYDAGTVVEFGGVNEITIGTQLSSKVAGVISTNPAYLMNDACQGAFVLPVALQGRCPVKVFGPGNKGDLLVSAGQGYAGKAINPPTGTVIGKALEDYPEGFSVIEVAVGRC